MKTLLIAWLVALPLYFVTSVVIADDRVPADFMHVWTGFSAGTVCIKVQDRVDATAASAELWLVNHNEVVWVKDIVGYSCIDVNIEDDEDLHVIAYDPQILISVVNDSTMQIVQTNF